MITQPKFEAIVDSERNLLRTRFAGEMTASAMHAAADNIETVLPGIRPGFTIFADFGKVTAMDIDCVPHLTRIMDLCRAHHVGLIVRILPEPDRDIGINLLALVHYRGEVKTVTVETLAEAERVLS